MRIELAGTPIDLLPQRAIFLPETSILIMGDLHLGKTMHFRKAGIFMPAQSAYKDYETLHELMLQLRPKQVYFLGDLFHSQHNSEWNRFATFLQAYAHVAFTLIKGNHDILKEAFYKEANINLIEEAVILDRFIFSHEPLDALPEGLINIAGHIHPGCIIKSTGRQYLKLPCFYFKENVLLLPAFGHLTGLHILDPVNATIFAIVSDRVIMI